ncbi:MAG: hypothetical protein IKV81_04385 [Clostridia bacterium]|nr:hypothetical protein [Clostridia bacterium]
MTKFKKLLSVLLVFVLCFAVCGVIASAAEDPTVLVYTSYAKNDASQVRLTIKTSKAYAAIAGTITYAGVTLEDAGHIFAEKTEDVKFEKVSNNQVKFALVTDNFGANDKYGDQYWASFKFNVAGGAISFDVDAQVADFDATKAIDPAYKVASVKTISTVGSLGAQYRDESDKYANGTAALRFGAKLDRTKNDSKVTVGGTQYKAVACGAILGYQFNIKVDGAELTDPASVTWKNYFDLEGAKLVPNKSKISGAKAYLSSKYYESKDNYLAYTFAITGIKDNHETYGNLQNEAIVFVPYTIYETNSGYDVVYGNAIAQSYTTVNEIYNFVKPAKQ